MSTEHKPQAFLTSPQDILAAATRLVRDHRTDIAVAFWGRGAAEAVALPRAKAGTRILLNADSGACNPVELETLLKSQNLEVRNCPQLHAKVIIGSEMLVGSANMSSNGLGLEGTELSGWREACTLLPTGLSITAAQAWFEDLWEDGEALDDDVIERARKAHGELRRGRIQRGYREQFLSIDALDGAPIYVVLTDDGISDADRRAFRREAKARKLNLSTVDFYQDWSSMPKDALLFAYDTEPQKPRCQIDDIWDTRGSRNIRIKNGAVGHPVFRARKKTLREFGAPTAGLRWTKSVNGVIRLLSDKAQLRSMKQDRTAGVVSSTDWCIPLYTFLVLCRAHGIELPSPWRT